METVKLMHVTPSELCFGLNCANALEGWDIDSDAPN